MQTVCSSIAESLDACVFVELVDATRSNKSSFIFFISDKEPPDSFVLRADFHQDLDMIIFVMNQGFEALFLYIVHLDLTSYHGLGFQFT